MPFAGPADDFDVGMVALGMLEQAGDQQRPVLHEALHEHVSFPARGRFGGPPARSTCRTLRGAMSKQTTYEHRNFSCVKNPHDLEPYRSRFCPQVP